MKFYCEITSWGEEALHFLDDPNANFIVIFDNNAPAELAEFSVLHTTANYNEDPAVGDEALHTLRQIGHCTLSFKGGTAPERPGCIMLTGDTPLTAADFKMGATIEVY